MLLRPRLPSSICILPRIIIFPRPVLYASIIPARPKINPPVGKSGPGKNFIISLKLACSGSKCSLNSQHKTFTISLRLCGGILVAIPTAMPVLPLTNKFGKIDGSDKGSFKLSSKFGPQSTVSSSKSSSISSPSLCSLASV